MQFTHQGVNRKKASVQLASPIDYYIVLCLFVIVKLGVILEPVNSICVRLLYITQQSTMT